MKVASRVVRHQDQRVVAATRRRSRVNTRDELQSAILRVKEKALRLSISAVAAEAGVHPSLIHNTYPDIAEAIRAQIGRATRQQRDAKAVLLTAATADLREARAELEKALAQVTKLASLNATLREELAILKAGANGKVVPLPSRTGP